MTEANPVTASSSAYSVWVLTELCTNLQINMINRHCIVIHHIFTTYLRVARRFWVGDRSKPGDSNPQCSASLDWHSIVELFTNTCDEEALPNKHQYDQYL